jgi:Phosphoribosylformimino-5-aminoimidazole carboxamide ribonucleotide (ProFAR) isomerase
MITGGSIAVKEPELFTQWINKYGSDKIILGADVKNKKIAVNGWKEGTELELMTFLKEYIEKGIQKVICTDIDCDGMLQGPSTALYNEILEKFPSTYLIASGGVSCIDDIIKLEEAKVPAVIFGKALYEGKIQLKDLKIFI